MPDISKLVRQNIVNLIPYSTARDEYTGPLGTFLDANENSLGSVLDPPLNRYPDPHQRELKKVVAAVKGLHPDQIFLGNGSDEAIDLLIRVFCEPGRDKLILMPPTYGMYAVSAAANNIDTINIPLTSAFEIDPAAALLQSKEAKLIFFASPNNPSGNCFRRDTILQLLDNFDGIVVIDEAYIDFAAEKSCLPLISEYKKLVIMQTFSKAWGLANLRLGMAFGHPQIIQWLSRLKYPYNINGVTQQLALKALKREGEKEAMVATILAERKRLEKSLNELQIVKRIYPSDANFLLVRFHNASEIFNFLIGHQIIVRDRSAMIHCENCLRITVGKPAENDALIQRLKSFEAT